MLLKRLCHASITICYAMQDVSTVQKTYTLYVHLPTNNIAELKPWESVHVDLIVTFSKSIRQQRLGGAIIKDHFSLICMKIINPATAWFEIVEIPTYDLNEVTAGNDEYIYKSSTRVSKLFNTTWLCRYPCPRKVVFDTGSEFKRYFKPFLKDLNIKTVLTIIKTHNLTLLCSGYTK